VGVFIILFGVIIVLLKFTPLSGLIFNQKKIRSSVIVMQQEMAALSDTVEAQNMQLNNIKAILVAAADSSGDDEGYSIHAHMETLAAQHHHEAARIPANMILVTNLFKEAGDFPASYPVEGIVTQKFNIDNGHLGLDIAADDGAAFKAIADGVIISQ
jgi:murein DD-endopeptidase MepM/ murein hydrolase activator NlpD